MKPKQLISITREDCSSKLVIDEVALKKVLKKAGGRKVAVISITGSKRSGKSYLLNYILRLFSWEYDENEDWLNWDNIDAPLSGFEWSGGKDAVTFGVWIWSEPLIIKTSKGEVALLLLDAQGTINEYTTEEESTAITALCFLLSSITIYNVKNDIEEDNLQLLKKGVQLCKDIEKENLDLHELLFTIRDWKVSNGFQCDADGAANYLQKKFEIKRGFTDHSKLSRQVIESGFKILRCKLFPDPGSKVTDESHRGALKDMNPEFSDCLQDILHLFDPNSLHKKDVGDIEKYFKRCTYAINNQAAPTASEQKENTTYLNAFDLYKENMNIGTEEFFTVEQIKGMHDTALHKAKLLLDSLNSDTPFRAMQDILSKFDILVQEYFSEVETLNHQKIKEMLKSINASADAAKEQYNEGMRSVLSRSTTTENIAKIKHNNLKEEAMATFLEMIPKKYKKANLSSHTDDLENDLEEMFTKLKQGWRTKTEQALTAKWEIALPKALEDYTRKMNELFAGKSFLEPDVLKRNHDKVCRLVMHDYCSELDFGTYELKFQNQLQASLDNRFSELDDSNRQNMVEIIEGKIGKALAVASKKCREILNGLAKDTEMTPDVFATRVEEVRLKIQEDFSAEMVQEPENIRNEYLRKLEIDSENQQQSATEIYESARRANLKAVEDKKREVQRNISVILTGLAKSSEILTEEKLKDENNRLERKVIKMFEALTMEKSLPSNMLDNAKTETIQMARNNFKTIAEKAKLKIAQYEEMANEIVKECFTSYQTFMKDYAKLDSEIQLQELHAKSVIDCIEEFKMKSSVKDENWLQPFIKILEEKVNALFNSDIKMAFTFSLENDNLQLNIATTEATKLYREEMEGYFKSKPFTPPKDLLLYHSTVANRICNKVGSKLKEGQKEKLFNLLDRDYKSYEDKNRMNTPTEDPAIGIDLGTTYTCVAIYGNGDTKIILNEQGHSTFPSYVAFTETGEQVGQAAKDLAYLYPQSTIFDAKRLIGRRYNEETVQKDIQHWPFQVINDNNIPKLKVETKDGPKIFTPETISAKILRHVKVMAERQLGKVITKAVITVPAYFNDGQRQATKDAGEIAGFEVLQIINEPTAAAIAYHLSTKGERNERNVLVYDLGGGTFDVVILHMKPGGSITVKSVNGDTHLGGEDFDDNLLKESITRHKNKTGIDLSAGKDSKIEEEKVIAARILRRLRNACEMAKISVSGGENTSGFVNVAALDGDKNFLEPITRQEFEDLNMDLFFKTLDIVGKALKDAKLEKGDINDIVLVGGSTRIPKIQEMLRDYFDGKVLSATVNPDEAVACGAAIQAAILNGNKEHILKNIVLKDVTPLSLGVELADGTFSAIVTRNSQLPANQTEDYYTSRDFQTEVAVVIYEGEENKAKDNHLLGRFMLKGIPSKREGVEKILVNMEVDKEGILRVTALCTSTGSKSNIIIEDHRGRLTKAEKRALKEEFDAN